MAEQREGRHTRSRSRDPQIPNELRDDLQKEQPEEFPEIQRETDVCVFIETSCGRELLQKIKDDFSHNVKPQNVLLCFPKYDSRALAERSIQKIQRVIDREGDIAGAECLLDHLVLYKGWLPCLLKVLRDPNVSSHHAADFIEKAAELLREEMKRRKPVVEDHVDGTCKETEEADQYTDLPQTSLPGVFTSPGRPKPMTRTISYTKLTTVVTIQETLPDHTSGAYATGMSPTENLPLRTQDPVSDDTPTPSREETTPRHTPTGENKRQIDVLLVGKTGNGKSSAGNSILLNDAFKSSDDMTSCTKKPQFEYSWFGNINFKVVDGPGLGDSDLDKEDAFKLVLDSMSGAISMNAEGYHAILLVVRFGGTFTDEDVTTIEALKKIFGTHFIKDHAILLMTYGDDFNKKAKKGKYNFEQWCERQQGVFQRLLCEVNNRIVLFDNMTDDPSTRCEQLLKLVEVINNLSSEGKRYTNEMFEKAREIREEEMAGSFLHESVLREAALISKRFYEINLHHVGLDEAYESLQTLLKRAKRLEDSIKKQESEQGVPEISKKFAEDLIRFLEDEIESIITATDTGKQTKPEEEGMKEGRVLNEEEHPQEQIGVESVGQMTQSEVMEPEEFGRKGEDLTLLLQEKHKERAEQVEEGYRSIKDETAAVLARMRESIREMLDTAYQWVQGKFHRGEIEPQLLLASNLGNLS